MNLIYETNPRNYDEFNELVNDYTSKTIISINKRDIKAFDVILRTEYTLNALRVINRKKYTIKIILKDISIIVLENKTKLVTLFSDDEFIFFSSNNL